MSRIHEALTKAKLEEDTLTAPTDILPSVLQTRIAPKGVDSGKSTETKFSPPAVSSSGAGLRFEDIQEGCTHLDWRPDPQTDVFTNPDLGSEAAEQFRTLRSRMHYLRTEQPLRTVLVTSAIAGDGKTFVAANLARAIVRQAERRVLLIDADLRSPRLHSLLGAPASPGLAEYLSGSNDEMSVIQHGQEGGLYFIGGGKAVSNASELLSNGRLKALIETTAPSFDWVIIDSPPCLPVADASVIASQCNGVLLVVRAGSTPSSAANKACNELRKRNVIGVVFNGVDARMLPYGAYTGRRPYPQRLRAT